MALIKCNECEKEISNTVKKCPHCGAKIGEKKINNKVIIIGMAILITI